MLNSVITLMLAASLSSSELGTFFDLPDWMPREVSSHNTPGSDPQDGTGWYVTGEAQIETARVTRTTHFSPIVREYSNYVIEEDSVSNVTKKVSQPTWDKAKRAWYVADSILPEDKGTDEPEYVYGYDQNPSTLYWDWADRFGTMSFLYTAETDRTTEDRYYKTVQGTIPRSFRLTPEILAAFNSTFEAYSERMYYTSCGQSNVWDFAYGPTDIRHFDFSKGGLHYQMPDGHSGKYPFDTNFNFAPTSRVINTRRLVDYTNFYNLFHWLCNLHLHQHWMTRIFRPSWKDGSFSDMDNSLDCDINFFHWFTKQDGGDLFYNPGFVDFTWNEHPYQTNSIRNAVLTFGSIERRDPDGCDTLWSDMSSSESPSDWYMRTEGYSIPLKRAFDQTYRLEKNDPLYRFPKTSISGIGFKHLLKHYFPHSKADGWSLYNPTRRRFSEGLSEANQILSLMDRTYKNIRMEDYGIISNFSARASIAQSAEIPIMLHVNPIQNRAWLDEEITPEMVTWGSPVTNSQFSCYEKQDDPGHIEYYFGGREVVYSAAEADNISAPVYLSLSDIQRSVPLHFRRPDYYELLISTAGSVPLTLRSNAVEGNDIYQTASSVYPHVNSYSNILHLTVAAEKATFVDKTILPSIKCSSFTFPGRDALPFVEDNQLFALMSILQSGNSGDKELFCGKTYRNGDSYTVRSTVPTLLMNKMGSIIGDSLKEYNLEEEDLSDLPSLVECNPNMLKVARENFYFKNVGLVDYYDATSYYLPMTVSLTVRLSADLDFVSASMNGPERKKITKSELENGIEIGRCLVKFVNQNPQAGGDEDDIPGTRLTSKCSFIQKIDWNWKALHRTDD